VIHTTDLFGQTSRLRLGLELVLKAGAHFRSV
jgi:hypothetical protein